MRWPDDSRADAHRSARDHPRREGQVPLTRLPRILAALAATPDAEAVVHWGSELVAVPAAPGELSLRLRAGTRLPLACRRCLAPVDVEVAFDRRFRLIPDVEEVADRDAQAEDHDVLWLDPALDLRELLEDELLLALPMMPVHDDCPSVEGAAPFPVGGSFQAQAGADSQAEETEPRQHPFADLAERLKRGH